MTRTVWLRRWLPVGAGGLMTVALWVFGFIPYHDQATRDMKQARQIEQQLQTELMLLQQIPTKKKELDSLLAHLAQFRSGLYRTDQVDDVMRAMEDRAKSAGVEFWSLDPSVPVLLRFEDSKDSLAALQLAVLPLEFECHGDFLSVGQFLEAEERRVEFATWESLTITPGGRKGNVRATAEATLYLLPARHFEGESS